MVTQATALRPQGATLSRVIQFEQDYWHIAPGVAMSATVPGPRGRVPRNWADLLRQQDD
jgi:hypothetical protein